MPSSLKCSRFRGLFTRAMIRSQRYFSLATWQIRRLYSSSPVTATTRSARWMPARSSTHSSVASPYWTACSSSCSTVRYRRRSCSITVTSWPFSISSRARFHPTLPAPAMITYSPATVLLDLRQRGGGELLDGDLRGADGLHALLGVPGGAPRVEHARDDLRHPEAQLGDLRDHEVGVVAVGGGDEDVGLLHPGLRQRVHLERRADREAAARLFPALAQLDVEALVGERVLVEDGDGMPGAQRSGGHGGPHPAGTDDEHEHGADSSPAAIPLHGCPGCRPARSE